MPYRFKRKEPVAEGMRRIALEQIDRARTELRDTEMEAAEAVHQARKRFKKLRGLLRLVRPALGGRQYKQQNRFFRDLGRDLSGARDAQVMLDTLEKLTGDESAGTIDADRLASLHGLLQERRERELTGAAGADLQTRRDQAAADLDEACAQLAHWELDARGFAALGPGLKRSYRAGRKALRKARRAPGATQFHELRKRVKDHWYHSRLLRGVWPGLMQAHARELKQLSDLLGDDHDLAVFRQTLVALADETPALQEVTLALLDIVDRRQRSLRRAARLLGARVYAESPRRFRKRLRAYWGVWRPDD